MMTPTREILICGEWTIQCSGHVLPSCLTVSPSGAFIFLPYKWVSIHSCGEERRGRAKWATQHLVVRASPYSLFSLGLNGIGLVVSSWAPSKLGSRERKRLPWESLSPSVIKLPYIWGLPIRKKTHSRLCAANSLPLKRTWIRERKQ